MTAAASKVVNLTGGDKGEDSHAESVGQLIQRDSMAQGVYSPLFQDAMHNAITPGLYEALREAIPVLDTLIDRLVTLDGVPVIVGDNKSAVQELNRFAREVQVGDNQIGLPSYTRAKRDEVHEQGFGISEHLLGSSGIYRLNVADSKAVHFARKAGGTLGWYFDPFQKANSPYKASTTRQVAQILRHRTPINVMSSFFDGKGYVELDRRRTHYLAFRTENSDAYGVSVLRSLPFFAEILLTIVNGIKNTHERFGDPSYHLHYKCSSRLGSTLDKNGDTPQEARRKSLGASLATAVNGKRDGKSADFVTVTDKDSDVILTIIGCDGQTLDAKVPLATVLEQITAKLPAWMLGINAGSVQGQAKFQSEVVQQESATRTDLESVHLDRLCAIHLRAMGVTWSDDLVEVEDPFSPNGVRLVRRDWRVEYRKPNLSDIVAKAQANFMNTQSDTLRDRAGQGEANNNTPLPITTEDSDGNKVTTVHNMITPQPHSTASVARITNHYAQTHNLETRPIESPALDKIESDALSAISDEWTETTLYIVRALGLESADSQDGMTTEGFAFTQADKDMLAAEMEGFVSGMYENTATSQGAMAKAFDRAWAQGVIDAYMRSGLDGPVGELNNTAAVEALFGPSSASFQTFIDNKMTGRIHRILEAGVEAGENPLNIAANLKREMGGASWKWEQIARSETAMAWDDAKRAEWGAEIESGDIDDKFDFIPAPDACPVCQGMATGNSRPLRDTPKPVFDTHPSCRCDIAPAIPESQS